MEKGHPVGEPRILVPDFSGVPLGVTTAGAFLYARSEPNVNYHYIVNRRPATGDQAITFPGMHAAWHRNNLVAFRSPGSAPGEHTLVIRSLETNLERTYKQPGLRLHCAETCPTYWLPDASGVIVTAEAESDTQRRVAFYNVNVATGSFARLFDRDLDGRLRSSVGAVSPDGKTPYLGARSSPAAQVSEVIASPPAGWLIKPDGHRTAAAWCSRRSTTSATGASRACRPRALLPSSTAWTIVFWPV
jgi:hypothetical protein